MQFSTLPIRADIAPFVSAVWHCVDLSGALVGEALRVTPHTGTVLCVHLGEPVETEFEDRRPLASLNGIQDRIRLFRPAGATRTLLILLTPRGAASLFPSIGTEIAGNGIDLGGLLGDGEIERLRRHAAAAPDEVALGEAVFAWLRRRLERMPTLRAIDGLALAAERLTLDGASVADAARSVDLSVRQLERVFAEHLGLSPKRFQRVHRLQRSLYAVLSGEGDPIDGYADQAHQIRNWRSYLGLTPGEVGRRGVSSAGAQFLDSGLPSSVAVAHYL
ncbi:helix-turn-helix domain-containing protein [Kaistia dalseonensis]|uniref:AraC-like DNA-binding protein n=1 Tax=Kaistia dalseonensis TaxID=410840 RepID=A0ABU0HBW5_9HYPH|nr:helix-turn-helix domain-containing protein [Kaistia dalseonensis]MCX5497178.1 helix-turn-helix domain-containing protein [Kaistia dalseonensis]MDQ0439809.1 AraC-like DNA-binding protein [Kaistia dalseonensis]